MPGLSPQPPPNATPFVREISPSAVADAENTLDPDLNLLAVAWRMG
jgi:hypothetical protein